MVIFGMILVRSGSDLHIHKTAATASVKRILKWPGPSGLNIQVLFTMSRPAVMSVKPCLKVNQASDRRSRVNIGSIFLFRIILDN